MISTYFLSYAFALVSPSFKGLSCRIAGEGQEVGGQVRRLTSFQGVPKTPSLPQQAMLSSHQQVILWSMWLWPERKAPLLSSLLLSLLYSRPPTFGGRLGREHTMLGGSEVGQCLE